MSESPEITTKVSPRSVSETVARLVEMVEARGMKVFAVIDQAAEARSAGLKVLVWADGQQTTVSYLAPDALGRRYHLSSDLASNLTGIDPLTDALVAS